MTFKTTKLRDAITFALVVGASGIGAAAAQETTTTPANTPTTLDRIEVVGSRIRSADIETSQPVFIVTREDIEKQGRTSIADVLSNLSVNGAPINTQVNNGGDGSAGVDLRGLGSARTLVLLNGRRWVTGLDSTVDLNTIPASIVERVEVLKDGASSIYGSDAIAGVVNIVTRTNFDGAEAHAYVGQFAQGDGQRTSYDFTLGSSTDRSNIVLGASYTKEGAVSAGNREVSRDPVYGFGARKYSAFSASGIAWDMYDAAGNPTGDIGAAAGYDMLVVNKGADGRDFANYHAFGDDDGYNYAKDNYLRTPQERTSLFVQGHFDVTDHVTFRTDALYNQRLSAQQLAGFPLSAGSLLGGDQGLLGSSYYNPTKGTADERELNWSHRLTEQARFYEQDVKTFHFYGGLDGYFEVGERMFNWDVGYSYNKNDQIDTQVGDVNMGNLYQATGASFMDTDGIVKCGTDAANVIAGCIPFNPLTSAGGVPADQLQYILFTAKDKFQSTSKSYTANITGDLFELPAGPLQFAAGFEHRAEAGYDLPDAFVSAGLSSGNARQPTSGGYSLDDLYLELLVPVLKDLPGAQLLEFSVASRYSDYSNFGDTVNSKFGFKWKPVDDVLVRGNYAEGFRAPSISNLFGGAGATYVQFGDPCSTDSPTWNPEVGARCAAAGVPNANAFIQRTNQGPGYYGQTAFPFDNLSNLNLGPETATNKTLGVVYSPSYVQGLDISLDWYNIKIENAISRVDATFMLDKCFVDNDAGYCSIMNDPLLGNIQRDSTGQINYLGLGLLNLASTEVEGYDLTVKYRLPETNFGDFRFVWDSAYMSKYDTRSDPDSDVDQLVGTYNQSAPTWRLRSTLSADWSMGDFGATWSSRYFSSLVEACIFKGADAVAFCSDPARVISTGPAPRNKIGAVTYHDVQVRYDLPWNARVSLGANNVFDKAPPTAYNAFANSYDPQYDTPGRFYYMEYRQKF